MTTTTMAAIIAHLVERIEALEPETVPERPFRYNKGASRPLRLWVRDDGGTDKFRRFDIEAEGRSDIGINNIEQGTLTSRPFVVTLAYPSDPKLYGLVERYELDELIENDARQIRDAVFLNGNADDAHHANLDPLIERTDKTDEKHWFQEISFVAVFDAAQRP